MVLDRKGERAAAIRVFDEFTARLGAELGADPSPETVALVDSLRSPDLHLAPSVPPAQPTTRPVEPPDDPQLEVLEPIAVPVPIPEEIPRHRVGRWKWSLSAVGGAIAVSLAIALSPALRHDPRSAFDPDLIAVARFDVPEPSLQLWGEGLVDLLSRSLDRAGPLRTVSQTVALRHWEGRADPASAAVLGSRTGAGLVVFGTVTRRGADSVSLRASVLDRSRNRVEGELEVVGAERRMAELGDSLGLLILRALGQSRPVGSLRLVSIGGRSLPALKEFLRGEQFYRRGLWDSALVHYQAAVAQDTAFPLALRRLAVVLSWNPATAGAYQPAEEYARRSMVLNHGLSPRESLLIVADSLNLAAQEATTALDLVSLRFRSMAALEEAARRYPGHAEVWYALGEARFHSARPLGGTPSYALEAFNRAIALDSGFAPAYEHGVQLAVQLGRPAAAHRYAEAYGRLDPTSANAESIRLAGLLLGPRRAQAEASRLIDSASLHTLFRAGLEHLGYWPDSAETAVQILLMMGQGSRSAGGDAPWVLDSLMWKQYAGRLLAFRGHLHQAYEIDRQLLLDPDASPYSGFQDPFLSLSLLGIIPDSLASAIFGRSLRPDSPWEPFTPRHLRGLPWWLARGDTTSLARFAARASEVVRQSRTPMTILRARLLGATAMAYLTLARGDSAGALQALAAIPDTLCLAGSFAASCFHVNLPLARLLGARGDHRKAIDLLDGWRWDAGIDPLFVIATLELGRAAEQLGDRERALASYRFVTDVWQRADPELRSCVLEARAGLARLTGSATSGGTHACGAVR